MTSLRRNSQIHQRQANFTADIFALIERSNIQIACRIIRHSRRLSVFVRLKKIKFAFAPDFARVALISQTLLRLFYNISLTALKKRTVGAFDVAEHSDNSSLRRSPWQYCNCRRVGKEKQIRMSKIRKSRNCRSVKAYALRKSLFYMMRHNGNVLLIPQNITKSKTYKFYVILFYKLNDFLFCKIIHTSQSSLTKYYNMIFDFLQYLKYKNYK